MSSIAYSASVGTSAKGAGSLMHELGRERAKNPTLLLTYASPKGAMPQ